MVKGILVNIVFVGEMNNDQWTRNSDSLSVLNEIYNINIASSRVAVKDGQTIRI